MEGNGISKSAIAKTSRIAGLLLTVAIALILTLPFRSHVVATQDEGVLLHGASRMLRGEVLYTDFFEFLPPGGFVISAAWLSVFGQTMMSARMLSILVIVGIAAFTYVACWHASRNASLSTALTLGWVISSQGEWTQLSHHWMTTLSLMICMAVIVGAVIPARGSFVWTFGAGLAGGTGAMITPTRGALVLIAAFFICLV